MREVGRHVRDERVLTAMADVPRHLFAPRSPMHVAYEDRPLPIGFEQTISQPSMVGIMMEALELRGDERVLEIGTGSGYGAAVLARLAASVYSVERVRALGEMSSERLARLGYTNVTVRVGDGYLGWPEAAPFDRILLTAAPEEIPEALLNQLAAGGLLVAPVGATIESQRLVRCRLDGRTPRWEDLVGVRFVPMVHDD